MNDHDRKLKIISGSSNVELSDQICAFLEIEKCNSLISTFSDGECRVEIDENVRGCDVFVIQSTCPPVNHNTMELAIMLDALKRSNCWRVTACIPYMGYARQDKKVKGRTPISAKLVADILSAAGIDRILTLDLHSGQIQGFYNCPVDNLYASKILLHHIQENNDNNVVLVSPDGGGVDRVSFYAKRLGYTLAFAYKQREAPGKIEQMYLVGEVKGKKAIVLDDMIDTFGTGSKASDLLLDNGATSVEMYSTHAVLSGPAIERIEYSKFSKIYITDTIPLSDEATKCSKISVLSVAPLLSAAIQNIHNETSVSCLIN